MALIDKLNAIGDAIRAKTGKSDKLTLDQMPSEIAGILTAEPYEGEYIITPTVDGQTMATKNKLMTNDVTIEAIPYAEVTNNSGGTTVSIG